MSAVEAAAARMGDVPDAGVAASEDEEVVDAIVDIPALASVDQDALAASGLAFEFSEMDTANPKLRLGPLKFEGRVEESVGSMFIVPNSADAENDPASQGTLLRRKIVFRLVEGSVKDAFGTAGEELE